MWIYTHSTARWTDAILEVPSSLDAWLAWDFNLFTNQVWPFWYFAFWYSLDALGVLFWLRMSTRKRIGISTTHIRSTHIHTYTLHISIFVKTHLNPGLERTPFTSVCRETLHAGTIPYYSCWWKEILGYQTIHLPRHHTWAPFDPNPKNQDQILNIPSSNLLLPFTLTSLGRQLGENLMMYDEKIDSHLHGVLPKYSMCNPSPNCRYQEWDYRSFGEPIKRIRLRERLRSVGIRNPRCIYPPWWSRVLLMYVYVYGYGYLYLGNESEWWWKCYFYGKVWLCT